jgi:hypothetical protein
MRIDKELLWSNIIVNFKMVSHVMRERERFPKRFKDLDTKLSKVIEMALYYISMYQVNRDMSLHQTAQELGRWIHRENEHIKIDRCLRIAYSVLYGLSKTDAVNARFLYDRYIEFSDACVVEKDIQQPTIKPLKSNEYNLFTSNRSSATEANHDVIDKLNSVSLVLDIPIIEDDNPTWFKDSIIPKWIDKEFYVHYKIDQGGRVYANSYDINPQGDDYRKACISLANKEKIDSIGLYWLQIAISSIYGNDKLCWKARMDWFQDNKQAILKDPVALSKSAKDPAQFIKMVQEYVKSISSNNYKSGVLIGMDMVSSGLALNSLITRDPKGCRLCNITHKRRNDPRKVIVNALGQYEDKLVKASMMQHSYWGVSTPKNVFGNDYDLFLNTMKDNFAGAEAFMDLCKRAFVKHYADKDNITYVLNGRLYSRDIYNKVSVDIGKCLMDDEIYITSTHTWYEKSANKRYRGIVAGITHTLDSILLEKIVELFPHDIVVNHDKFFCHPNYMDELRIVFKEAILWFYNQDFLAQLENQWDLKCEYRGDLKRSSITAEYAFC